MFFSKWAIALVLGVTTVPTGCAPFLIVGAVQEARETGASTKPWVTQRQRDMAVAFPTIVMSIWLATAAASWALWRRNATDRHPASLGLSASAWRVAIWATLALGVATGGWLYSEIV